MDVSAQATALSIFINEAHGEYTDIVKQTNLLKSGEFLRSSNLQAHFCVYFAAYDPVKQLVFLGHHRKAKLWLFSGGHLEENETPEQAVVREAEEEWGLRIDQSRIKNQKFLSITSIDNEPIQMCKTHYDLWHFLPVDSDTFNPNPDNIIIEYLETLWVPMNEVPGLATDKNTLKAIEFITNL